MDFYNFDKEFDHTSGLFFTLRRAFTLTKCQFRSGPVKNWPYKRVDLTSVDHISGRDYTTHHSEAVILLCGGGGGIVVEDEGADVPDAPLGVLAPLGRQLGEDLPVKGLHHGDGGLGGDSIDFKNSPKIAHESNEAKSVAGKIRLLLHV